MFDKSVPLRHLDIGRNFVKATWLFHVIFHDHADSCHLHLSNPKIAAYIADAARKILHPPNKKSGDYSPFIVHLYLDMRMHVLESVGLPGCMVDLLPYKLKLVKTVNNIILNKQSLSNTRLILVALREDEPWPSSGKIAICLNIKDKLTDGHDVDENLSLQRGHQLFPHQTVWHSSVC